MRPEDETPDVPAGDDPGGWNATSCRRSAASTTEP